MSLKDVAEIYLDGTRIGEAKSVEFNIDPEPWCYPQFEKEATVKYSERDTAITLNFHKSFNNTPPKPTIPKHLLQPKSIHINASITYKKGKTAFSLQELGELTDNQLWEAYHIAKKRFKDCDPNYELANILWEMENRSTYGEDPIR